MFEQHKFKDYPEVFRPGSPVLRSELFFGREQELRDIERCLTRPGLHPIVIGNRGVGKTSAVFQTLKKVDGEKIAINFNGKTTWETFVKDLLEELGVAVDETEWVQETLKSIEGNVNPLGIGISGTNVKTDEHHHEGFTNWRAQPWQVYKAIKRFGRKVIIILDEYDQVSPDNKELHLSLANLIKTLADRSHECDSRIVVVGIGQTAQDLLGEHPSIERSAREIYVRPLRTEDIEDFLMEAEKELGFKFATEVKKSIAMSSLGYPFFAHLVGLNCLDIVVDRNHESRTITVRDYQKAVKKAKEQAFQSTLGKYREAIDGLSDREISLLEELCTFENPNAVPRKDLKQHMVKKGFLEEAEFDSIWVLLQQERRLLHVSRKTDNIRFADPLMAPFLKAWYKEKKTNSTDH